MDKFLNFPGKLIVHCSDVRGIRHSAPGVTITLRDGDVYIDVPYAQVEAEWKRAREAADTTAVRTTPEQAAAMSEVFRQMDETFKSMDGIFKGMDGIFKSANIAMNTFGEKPNARRK